MLAHLLFSIIYTSSIKKNVGLFELYNVSKWFESRDYDNHLIARSKYIFIINELHGIIQTNPQFAYKTFDNFNECNSRERFITITKEFLFYLSFRFYFPKTLSHGSFVLISKEILKRWEIVGHDKINTSRQFLNHLNQIFSKIETMAEIYPCLYQH
ncbi:hypothetical protein TUBRATIS_23260 [Tubulinosema ratisbonensis]|uniref:Uncharacterized protein n=1 Tax=Tubulinosema ratisbonensis TaxID=291195 RepID=A0A437AJE1_9MICR|nr:hypothetical protein TUBRATIS_23260 [Tubulinosema ratisbonensis]